MTCPHRRSRNGEGLCAIAAIPNPHDADTRFLLPCDVRCQFAQEILGDYGKQMARAEKAEAEVVRVRGLIDRDRTGLGHALNHVRDILCGYGWLAGDSWGSYSYEEQTIKTLRQEIGWMMDACNKAIETGLRESGDLAMSAFRPESAGGKIDD